MRAVSVPICRAVGENQKVGAVGSRVKAGRGRVAETLAGAAYVSVEDDRVGIRPITAKAALPPSKVGPIGLCPA